MIRLAETPAGTDSRTGRGLKGAPYNVESWGKTRDPEWAYAYRVDKAKKRWTLEMRIPFAANALECGGRLAVRLLRSPGGSL